MFRVLGLGSRVSAIAQIVLAFFTASVLACVPVISNAELERRVRESHPAWPNYQEDIKAQIGATPVAEWQGSPMQARREGGAIFVEFQISGAWTHRQPSIPVLMRDPTGGVSQNASAKRSDASTTYIFPFPENAPDPAWVELKFPHGERRMILQDESKKSES